MPKVEANIFVDLVRKSGLVEDQRLAETLASIEHPISDSGIVCSSLINAGLLTPWQSEQLLAGRHNGFFLGKYKMLDKLGRGGMSSVYLAEHLEMGRRVAIKVLTRHLADQFEYLDRFKQEARAAARVDHPNIVRAYDVGHEGPIHYLVMEYIQGADLQQIVAEHGRLDFRIAANYIRQAAVGLAHVHDAGLIHRDIKPANFLVDTHGTLKIVDLGLARLAEETRASLETEGGEQVLGTADYLAPEQSLDSHNVTARTDVYSLGCSLYFLLAGQPPFPTGTLVERVRAHRNKEPQNLFELRPDAPAALVAICQKMMAKSPDDRYQTAEEVVDILQLWLDGKAPRTLGMMAVRPPRPPAPGTSKADDVDEEVLGLAPLDDEPRPSGSAIKKAKPAGESVRDSSLKLGETQPRAGQHAAKDSAVMKGVTETKPMEKPAVVKEPAKPDNDASLQSEITLESLEEALPPLGGLLDELPPEARGVGLPSVNLGPTSGPSHKVAEDTFPRWLLIVAGVAFIGVVGMIVGLVISSMNR